MTASGVTPIGAGGKLAPLTVDEVAGEFDDELAAGGYRVPPREVASLEMPAFDLGRLATMPTQDFVTSAYRTILGRASDESGERHFQRGLAEGTTSRIEILGNLRYSDEGRARGVPVPGLRRRLFVAGLYRLPVIGRFLRIPASIIAIPGVIRGLRGVEDRVFAHQQLLADRRLSDQVREQARLAGERFDQVNARLDRLADLQTREPWIEPLLMIDRKIEALTDRLHEDLTRVSELRSSLDTIVATGSALEIARRAAGWDEEGEALAGRFIDTVEEQRRTLVTLRGTLDEQRRRTAQLDHRLSHLLAAVRRTAGEAGAQTSPGPHGPDPGPDLDPLYVEFEGIFRGTRDDIKQRQRAYLPTLHEAVRTAPPRAVVDVGSGRGEFLELLREEDVSATGVDLNAVMVGICEERGLACVQADAVAYLGGIEPDTLGAVTGFHIIEHLPFAALVALLDAALRALASGGMILLETPNPANLMTSSRWFYLDPTHRNPIPAEMLAMIVEARGFVGVEIREINPSERRFAAKDNVLAEQLDKIFYGPQDYALIARKP